MSGGSKLQRLRKGAKFTSGQELESAPMKEDVHSEVERVERRRAIPRSVRLEIHIVSSAD